MNINMFFVGIMAGLIAIFYLFEPLDIKKQDFGEIPVFELEDFKLIELTDNGLSTVMNGTQGIRYTNRYIVYNINYTDNSKIYRANMLADEGLYKGNIINLNGNITYKREDGISFKTQKAIYNKKTNIVTSSTKYTSYMGEHKAQGSYIRYNNARGIMKSKNVTINYKLKER